MFQFPFILFMLASLVGFVIKFLVNLLHAKASRPVFHIVMISIITISIIGCCIWFASVSASGGEY